MPEEVEGAADAAGVAETVELSADGMEGLESVPEERQGSFEEGDEDFQSAVGLEQADARESSKAARAAPKKGPRKPKKQPKVQVKPLWGEEDLATEGLDDGDELATAEDAEFAAVDVEIGAGEAEEGGEAAGSDVEVQGDVPPGGPLN